MKLYHIWWIKLHWILNFSFFFKKSKNLVPGDINISMVRIKLLSSCFAPESNYYSHLLFALVCQWPLKAVKPYFQHNSRGRQTGEPTAHVIDDIVIDFENYIPKYLEATLNIKHVPVFIL